MPSFVTSFATDDFWQRDPSKGFPNGQKGLCHWTSKKFMELCQQLGNQPAMAFAEFIYGTFTTAFDVQYLQHCDTHPEGGHGDQEGIALLLRGSGTDDPLTMAFKKYTKALSAQGTSIPDEDMPAQPLAGIAGIIEEDDGTEEVMKQEKKHLLEKIIADRQNQVRFHALPHLPFGPLGNFTSTSLELTRIMQHCPFHAPAIGGKLGVKEKAKSRAFLLSVDLFPGCMNGGAKDFRLPTSFFKGQRVVDSLKALWGWVKTIRKPEDSIVVFDGRFPSVRRFFDAEMAELGEEFVLDMWIIYDIPHADPRYPKREKAFGKCNREVILMYRPVQKKKDACNARVAFNLCGEQSTFDSTYSGVKLRTLGELPKLTTADKKKMMGKDLDVPLSYPEEDQSVVGEGVPFSWQESKPVDWWVTFFKDMGFDHIFDTTPGSAAAAIGAHYSNIQYDALCLSPLHKRFCDELMNQAMFAIVSDGGAGATKEHITKVLHFFGPMVEAGMRMIKREAARKEPAAPQPGDDDDNEDDEEDDNDGFN